MTRTKQTNEDSDNELINSLLQPTQICFK